ncbi:MAG: recombinase family protein, partial [Fibrella sp.]|nr:recombinase family protein [Armatimonadota bacterium]
MDDMTMSETSLEGLDKNLDTIIESTLENAEKRLSRRKNNRAKGQRVPPPDPRKWREAIEVLKADGKTDLSIGYWRQSTINQTDGFGQEVQMRNVISWAIARSGDGLGTISERGIDLWVYDVDSGQEEARVGTEFIRELFKEECLNAVVVPRFDRFARNQYYSELLHREAKQSGVRVYSATENLPTGALGDLMRQMLQAIAQYESALIAYRLNAGRKAAIRNLGVFHGAEAPYGYMTVGDRFVGGKGKIDVCESEAAVVRIIFALRYRGYGGTHIAEWLNRKNIPTRYVASNGWHATQIYNVLRHETGYRGEGLFHDVDEYETIAHTAILPTRPEGERISALNDVKSLQRVRIPDDPDAPPESYTNRQKPESKMAPEYARTILYALRLRERGVCYREINERLNERGRKTFKGRSFTLSAVQHAINAAQREGYMDAIRAVIDVDAEPYDLPESERVSRVDAEKAAVARILELRAGGNSYRTIERMLAEEGYRTGYGNAWCASSVTRACKGTRRLAREVEEGTEIPGDLPTDLRSNNIGKFATADHRVKKHRERT